MAATDDQLLLSLASRMGANEKLYGHLTIQDIVDILYAIVGYIQDCYGQNEEKPLTLENIYLDIHYPTAFHKLLIRGQIRKVMKRSKYSGDFTDILLQELKNVNCGELIRIFQNKLK